MASKKFGYVRVSTANQVVDRQVDLLKKEYGIPEEDIFVDVISGAKFERPALARLQSVLRENDCIYVESLSRVSRSSADLLALLNDWQVRKVNFFSDKEKFDFGSTSGRFLLTILSAVCELERATLRDRVREGLQSARERGRIGGRPKTDKKALEKALKLHASGTHSISEIVDISKVSKSVLYRALREKKEAEQLQEGAAVEIPKHSK